MYDSRNIVLFCSQKYKIYRNEKDFFFGSFHTYKSGLITHPFKQDSNNVRTQATANAYKNGRFSALANSCFFAHPYPIKEP